MGRLLKQGNHMRWQEIVDDKGSEIVVHEAKTYMHAKLLLHNLL